MVSVINPRTIRFFLNLALIFEPLAPRAIKYYASRSLGDWKQEGLIDDYKLTTKRVHKFHYRIQVDVDLNARQTHYVLRHVLPKRMRFWRRWFNV